MTAKELFEAIGYEQVVNNEVWIEYRHADGGYVTFAKKGSAIAVHCNHDFDDFMEFDVACWKQMEELDYVA